MLEDQAEITALEPAELKSAQRVYIAAVTYDNAPIRPLQTPDTIQKGGFPGT